MPRGGSQFDRYAAHFTAAVVLRDSPPVSAPVASVLASEGLVRA